LPHPDIAAGAADVLDDEDLAGRLLKRGRGRCGRDVRSGPPDVFATTIRTSAPDRRQAPSCARMMAGAAKPVASAPLRIRRRDSMAGARDLLIVLPSVLPSSAVVVALMRDMARLKPEGSIRSTPERAQEDMSLARSKSWVGPSLP
jgi:hypothetical protein